VKTYKKSALDPNIAYLYAQFYPGLRQKGQWQQLATTAENFLRYRPDDTSSIQAATQAYQQLGNPRKLVDFGSKLYADSPNATTAYFVAKAYQALNDQANFRKWGQRAAQYDPNNLPILVDLSSSYWKGNDLGKAVEYAKKALVAADKLQKPEGQTDQQWTSQLNQVRGYCHRALGEQAYVNKDMSTARKEFEAAAQHDVTNDFAHYRLGFIYWGAGRIDQANLSFAKATVLNGPSSKDARDQLNQLYRSTHGNTSGIPTLIQRARQEVGM
jgi:tetratricopeptide (TPR) repeat protein